jgi:hypothetical protein
LGGQSGPSLEGGTTDWLARALVVTPSLPPVSETIKTSETSECRSAEASFGGFGGFDAGGSHVAGASPELAIDGTGGWREALLALPAGRDPCPGFRPDAWVRVLADAIAFLDRHGGEAHALGWTAEELFGVHPVVGAIRVDHCGALMLSAAGRVASVGAGAIRYAGGLVFRRSPLPAAAVPVWAFIAGGCKEATSEK